jgi:hypothetical protein
MEKQIALNQNEMEEYSQAYKSVDTRNLDPSRLMLLDPQPTPPIGEHETQFTQDL